MTELNEKVLKRLKLDEKVELFWNPEHKKFQTADQTSVKVEPLGEPLLIILGHRLEVRRKRYDPFLVQYGRDYWVEKGEELDPTIKGNSSLLEQAKYFCKGAQSLNNSGDPPTAEHITIPIMLYR